MVLYLNSLKSSVHPWTLITSSSKTVQEGAWDVAPGQNPPAYGLQFQTSSHSIEDQGKRAVEEQGNELGDPPAPC